MVSLQVQVYSFIVIPMIYRHLLCPRAIIGMLNYVLCNRPHTVINPALYCPAGTNPGVNEFIK